MKIGYFYFLSLFFYLAINWLVADDGMQILQTQCSSCHAITKPTDNSLERLWTRKGPDLYYAGLKFQKEWLVKWLQQPTVIRPAGEFYFKHIKKGPNGDEIDVSSLSPHPKLSPNEAESVANALMSLKPEGLIIPGKFKNEPVNPSIGAMFFGKLRGCSACHATKEGGGGLSGPELYDAGDRLQGDFIYSFIEDPQKFEPHIWMPKLELAEADLQRLSSYLMSLHRSQQKEGK
ncbi:cytochrome C [Candidatus Methylacidiphilum fumarolicum]|uniref:Cytochrome c, class I n=2 Tax=Candidatus Methylacidiphilum fumarolicum TaxID=591154 RepID=I0JWT9_METFB|nr:cytochrome c [Candidatus Methylacidiphilum fumarolicum]MBW6414402.1 cytochrome c [Candidatus Methylacidiphilum fumarolicum]TFE69409.1 cytochrome C [Candidatus Methylacidiphilum fumarolicum]TFE72886.1 cytochrome C [Candidatus Methylacidiphilum fumarolicum]TFE74629.1 cytochrome C [Candidatus Methylacidiphilum fumarolicum]TFE77195.1 cytochrome C [Candidatus Methylacidiphilum fumarolicum]